jgi:AcrR family transcriptional regulator
MRTKRRFEDSETLIASQNIEFASTPNSELIEKKHRQIVDGACRVFFRKGYHPTTIRDIARECGMSIGQLYHYISSKDDVLYLVHKHQQRIWHQYLQNSDIREDDDPLEKFKKSLHHSLQFMIKNKN